MELFDSQKDAVGQGERTILVHIELTSNRQASSSVGEFQRLALSSGLSIIDTITVKRSITKAQYFIGTGKVDELATIVCDNEINRICWRMFLGC